MLYRVVDRGKGACPNERYLVQHSFSGRLWITDAAFADVEEAIDYMDAMAEPDLDDLEASGTFPGLG